MIVAPALARVMDEFPRVRFHVVVERSRRSVRQLRRREIDLLVGELSDLGGMSDLTLEPLQSHQGYFVTRTSHPVIPMQNMQLTDVLRYPLVTAEMLPERVTGPLYEALGANGHAPGAIPAIQTDSTALMRAIVTASNAIGTFTLTMIAGELRRGELAVLPVVPPWLCTNFGIVRLANRTPSPAAEHFIQLVKLADGEITQRESELRREFLVPPRKRTPPTRKRGTRARRSKKRG
jgi:DNA-binding transcriptional LysR family regulator